jgi:hypothetical protein
VNALILTPYTAELRFQGVNLAGSDLSRLDLRYINFKVGIKMNEIWLAMYETNGHQISPFYSLPVLNYIVSSDHAIEKLRNVNVVYQFLINAHSFV